jgi:hypothetical protein
MTHEPAIKRSMWQFVISYGLALALILRDRVVGVPAFGMMTIAILALGLVRWGLLTMSFVAIAKPPQTGEQSNAGSGDPESHRKFVRSVHLFQAFVVIMPSLLALILLMSNRVLTAVINLSLAWLFFHSLGEQKTALLEQHDAPTSDATEQQITIKADTNEA